MSCVALKYVFVLQHYWCFERRGDYSCTNALHHDCKLLNCVLITRWMVSLLFSPKVQHPKGILSFSSLAQSNLLPILKKNITYPPSVNSVWRIQLKIILQNEIGKHVLLDTVYRVFLVIPEIKTFELYADKTMDGSHLI